MKRTVSLKERKFYYTGKVTKLIKIFVKNGQNFLIKSITWIKKNDVEGSKNLDRSENNFLGPLK